MFLMSISYAHTMAASARSGDRPAARRRVGSRTRGR
jgi:hypothetical protein